MRGLEWGRLYDLYHDKPYDPKELSAKVKDLYGDPYVKNRRGIWEYVLGDSKDAKLLDIRVFDEATKNSTYARQTKDAQLKGMSNCSNCTLIPNANDDKIWKLAEMDADHVSPWSKGGSTTADNCQMLCRTHNQAKGNK
jgi:5-methylcytosine-specific restriction endonuclease McrA